MDPQCPSSIHLLLSWAWRAGDSEQKGKDESRVALVYSKSFVIPLTSTLRAQMRHLLNKSADLLFSPLATLSILGQPTNASV
jgi:hypothetical protein